MNNERGPVPMSGEPGTDEKQRSVLNRQDDQEVVECSAFSVQRSAFSCITCSDEALTARVLRVNQQAGLALVAVQDTTIEVDISLVDEVEPEQILLVHGGVAIAHLGEER